MRTVKAQVSLQLAQFRLSICGTLLFAHTLCGTRGHFRYIKSARTWIWRIITVPYFMTRCTHYFFQKSSTLSLGNIPTGGDESDDNNNREPSPRQPPPSPEPIPLPTAPKSPPPTKRRACVTKKTKKPVDRTRKMKEIDIPKEPDPPREEPEPTPPPVQDRLVGWRAGRIMLAWRNFCNNVYEVEFYGDLVYRFRTKLWGSLIFGTIQNAH